MAEKGSRKDILVLGGSYAGVCTAHYVLKHVIPALPDASRYHLTLVSASAEFFHRPASVRAVISDKLLAQDKVFYKIDDLFKGYSKDSFTFLHATATSLDPGSRTVTVSAPNGNVKTLNYYALVIATGTRATSPLLSLHTDSDLTKKSWSTFREALPHAKSIVIAGGGPTSVELAGELGEHLNGRAGFFQSTLAAPKVPITVVTAGAKILPALRPAIAATAESYLSKVGVSVLKNARVESVAPLGAGEEDPRTGDLSALATRTKVTLSTGDTLTADLYIPATGVKPNTSFVPVDLLTERGYVDVDGTTLRLDRAGPRVYAIGDVGAYTRGGIMDIYETVPILATNIKRDLKFATLSSSAADNDSKGQSMPGQDRPYKPNLKETQLVPVGRSKGVGAIFGWRLPSFFVWLIKGRDYFVGLTPDAMNGKKWNKESKWKFEG